MYLRTFAIRLCSNWKLLFALMCCGIIAGPGEALAATGCSRKSGEAVYKRCLAYLRMAGTPKQRKASADESSRNRKKVKSSCPKFTSSGEPAGCISQPEKDGRDPRRAEEMKRAQEAQQAQQRAQEQAAAQKAQQVAAAQQAQAQAAAEQRQREAAAAQRARDQALADQRAREQAAQQRALDQTAAAQRAREQAATGQRENERAGEQQVASNAREQPNVDRSRRTTDAQAPGSLGRASSGAIAGAASGAAIASAVWTHNNSLMRVADSGGRILIAYVNPRPELSELGIRSGTVLFSGARTAGNWVGQATTFTRRCGERQFDVSGIELPSPRRLELRGRKPRLDDNCNVAGYRDEVLVFDMASAAR